jgi:hypothetical protein
LISHVDGDFDACMGGGGRIARPGAVDRASICLPLTKL